MSLVQQLELGPCDLKLDSSTRGRLSPFILPARPLSSHLPAGM